MLKTHIILFFRNFRKNVLYGSLNLFGLSMAITAFGLIAMYIHYESSFENFHVKKDRIYRVSYKTASSNGDAHWARVPVDYVNQLPEEVNGIRQLVRLQNHERKYIKIGTRKFLEDHLYQTDAEIFEVFSLTFIEGDPATALTQPKSIVITEATARKYFGDTPGLHQEVIIAGEWDPTPVSYKVTGVIADVPKNTHLPIDVLISFDNPAQRTWWAYTYLLLDEGVQAAQLEAPIADFVAQHTTNELQEESLVLQALEKIYLESDLAREIIPNGSRQNIKIFAVIGLLILLVGMINFTNLSSVVYLSRLKEVGIRLRVRRSPYRYI